MNEFAGKGLNTRTVNDCDIFDNSPLRNSADAKLAEPFPVDSLAGR